MKLFYTLLLSLAGLLISSHSIAQGSLAALDAKNGFKDAKLGTARTQFKGLVPYKGDKLGSMVRPSDVKRIGDIPLKYIKYNFYKGKLASILVIADISYKDAIISTLKVGYGPGVESVGCYRAWKGNKVVMTLPFVLVPDDSIVGVLIKIESIAISQQINADYAAKEAGSFGRFIDKKNREAEKIGKKRQLDL